MSKKNSHKTATGISFKTRLSLAAQFLACKLAGKGETKSDKESREEFQERLCKDALSWADALIKTAEGNHTSS